MGGISIDSPNEPEAPAAPRRYGAPPTLVGTDGKLHRHPGRAGPAWEKCKRIVKARDRTCHMCGLPLVPRAVYPAPDSTECDHQPVTLAMMDNRGYSPDQIRHLSTDPANVKAVHRSCHLGAGPPRSLVPITNDARQRFIDSMRRTS